MGTSKHDKYESLRRFFIEKRYNLVFIDLENIVHNAALENPGPIDKARKLAAKSDVGALPGLKSTESNFHWTLLYNHARQAQIRPLTMHRMRRRDLEYLAGMSLPHPELSAPRAKRESKVSASKRYGQQTKLQGNAIRAQGVLLFRNVLWAGVLAAAATLAGVLLTKAIGD